MQDRIYCAEQIKIPLAYPEIMRLYSKAVLVEQPNDIIRFSIKYFGRLNSEQTATPEKQYQVNLKQIKEIYTANKDGQCEAFIEALKNEIGQERATQLQKWVQFCQETYNLEQNKSHIVLALLFSLITNSLYDSLSGLFYVLQGQKMGFMAGTDFSSVVGILDTVDYRMEISNKETIANLCAQPDVFFDDVVKKMNIIRR